MQSYITVAHAANEEYTVKRSRFIGYIKPVSTQEEALNFIAEIRSRHWDATHNVYAYVLREGQIRRYSDDGEPQGTAGIPVLDVLLKEEITDCCVVVTRYFGGVLLGGGGLVRAYSHSAKLAVVAGEAVTMSLCIKAVLRCDYGFYGKASSLIPEFGGKIEESVFEEDVKISFLIPEALLAAFQKELTEQSFGKVGFDKIGELFAAT